MFMHARSLQSCLTLCDPMDYSLPGSTIYGIFQARILEWVVISFSKYHVCYVLILWRCVLKNLRAMSWSLQLPNVSAKKKMFLIYKDETNVTNVNGWWIYIKVGGCPWHDSFNFFNYPFNVYSFPSKRLGRHL